MISFTFQTSISFPKIIRKRRKKMYFCNPYGCKPDASCYIIWSGLPCLALFDSSIWKADLNGKLVLSCQPFISLFFQLVPQFLPVLYKIWSRLSLKSYDIYGSNKGLSSIQNIQKQKISSPEIPEKVHMYLKIFFVMDSIF